MSMTRETFEADYANLLQKASELMAGYVGERGMKDGIPVMITVTAKLFAWSILGVPKDSQPAVYEHAFNIVNAAIEQGRCKMKGNNNA